MIHNKEVEERIREIGRTLYARSASDVPSVFDRSRWTGNAVDWAMTDERFKINLFRFIDVLPALKTDALVVKVLKEYFSDEKEERGAQDR